MVKGLIRGEVRGQNPFFNESKRRETKGGEVLPLLRTGSGRRSASERAKLRGTRLLGKTIPALKDKWTKVGEEGSNSSGDLEGKNMRRKG